MQFRRGRFRYMSARPTTRKTGVRRISDHGIVLPATQTLRQQTERNMPIGQWGLCVVFGTGLPPSIHHSPDLNIDPLRGCFALHDPDPVPPPWLCCCRYRRFFVRPCMVTMETGIGAGTKTGMATDAPRAAGSLRTFGPRYAGPMAPRQKLFRMNCKRIALKRQ